MYRGKRTKVPNPSFLSRPESEEKNIMATIGFCGLAGEPENKIGAIEWYVDQKPKAKTGTDTTSEPFMIIRR